MSDSFLVSSKQVTTALTSADITDNKQETYENLITIHVMILTAKYHSRHAHKSSACCHWTILAVVT